MDLERRGVSRSGTVRKGNKTFYTSIKQLKAAHSRIFSNETSSELLTNRQLAHRPTWNLTGAIIREPYRFPNTNWTRGNLENAYASLLESTNQVEWSVCK
mgnify:CR=1 FL=1